MACVAGGEGVDEPALRLVDLHVGVDQAEGVGVPVFAAGGKLTVWTVDFD
jgi:hypothetical protein